MGAQGTMDSERGYKQELGSRRLGVFRANDAKRRSQEDRTNVFRIKGFGQQTWPEVQNARNNGKAR